MTKKSIVMNILRGIEENIKKGNIEEVLNGMYDLANEYDGVISIINDNIIDTEIINELIKERINDGADWVNIKILLEGIHYMNDNYYHIDGYGDIEDLTIGHLEDMYEDIKSELIDILEEK